jgi:lipopolysaccharide transport system permease protein
MAAENTIPERGMAGALPAAPDTVIRPSRGWADLRLRELWAYRELLYFLAWRDIKVRYKQTVLGATWAVLQPFASMIVFTLFFNRLAGIQADGDIPYPVFSFAALVPWTFFASRLASSSDSLVASANLIKKVYFPRLVIPLASVLGGLPDLVLSFTMLLVLMVIFGIVPTLNIVFLPFFVLMALLTALGVGLWFSAMNVQFRDIKYTIPFIVQIWMFATPIVYSSSLIENETLRALYGINPMVGVVEGFRWALLGVGAPPGPMVLVSFAVVLVLVTTGLYYFRRMEKSFADVI